MGKRERSQNVKQPRLQGTLQGGWENTWPAGGASREAQIAAPLYLPHQPCDEYCHEKGPGARLLSVAEAHLEGADVCWSPGQCVFMSTAYFLSHISFLK